MAHTATFCYNIRIVSITVIVPVYNVAPYLRAGLEALSAQVGCTWSALCVDDGSTDGSGDILDAYAARDARLRVLHLPHAGVSAARNAGLAHATSELIAFMDPDDLVEPDWLARLVAVLGPHDWALTGYRENGRSVTSRDVGATYAGDAVRRRAWQAFFGYRLRDLVKVVSPGGLWHGCRREMAGVWRCVFRREALADLRFDTSLSLYEDAMFLARVGSRARSLVIAPDCGYRWQVRPTGAMTRQMREHAVVNKFAVRDIRRAIDPSMTHWRGSWLLSTLEILCATHSPATALRYLTGGR